jgi:hypothetical protein
MICQNQATLIINFTDKNFFNPKIPSIFMQSSKNECDLFASDLATQNEYHKEQMLILR